MLTGDHHQLALSERGRDAEVLLDQQDRETFLLESPKGRDHPLDDCRRKAFGGLVHDDQLRVGDEGAPDREHLLLAARELRTAVALPLGETREEVVDAFSRPVLAAVRSRAARRDSKVLVDRERREQPAPLWHVADAAAGDLVGLPADQLLPLEADRPVRCWVGLCP